MTLDIAIFASFLLFNIFLGLASSRGIKTIKEYAIGDRNFSTATIVATIVATWIGGGFFCTLIPESYGNGLHFIWVTLLGDLICLSLIALFFAPRMGEFLGKLSIADAMRDLYGRKVQIVTAISGFIGVSGLIAMQFKIAGMMFEYALEISKAYGILSAGLIVTLYSALGGIKSVTFTDVIQFITFAIVMPILAYSLLQSLDNIDIITHTINNNSIFDYRKVFDFSQPQSLYHLFVFFFFAIPGFNIATFQRVAMAKNTSQITKSFLVAAIVCFIIGAIICWIGVLVLAIKPNLDSGDVIKYLISDYAIVGLKGMLLAGVMAMVMSTVDSYINATAVLVIHDFCKPLKIKFVENELFSARVVSLLIGSFAIILSLYGSDKGFLQLFILANSFYMPIVSVPFLMAILGFRSTEKSVLLGMISGLSIVLVWKILDIKVVNSIIVGMTSNLIMLVGSHYLLKQPGGWIGIKDSSGIINARKVRKRNLKKFWLSIKSFNIVDFCKNNDPKGEGLTSILGFFVMISIFSSTHTLSKEYQLRYASLLDVTYPIALCCSALMISYPLWLTKWKEKKLIGILWNFTTLAVLICFSFLMVLISKFSEVQLMAFMINIIIISSLSRWQLSLFNILFGVFTVTFCYKHYYPTDILEGSFISSQFKIAYLLLLVSSSLVLFLKPKQQRQELIEEKAEHLASTMDYKDGELQKALTLKNEFIRNITHEYHAPMTGVINTAEALLSGYEYLDDIGRKKAIETIYNSAIRLESFDANIRDLARLSSGEAELSIAQVNLSELIVDRLNICKKLYIENIKQADYYFIANIENNVIAEVDEYYLKQTLDNLIVNALNYCKQGTIKLELKKQSHYASFSITDQGIGIPKDELYDIFGEFTVSSKTRTPAGGRGVGLALCKRVLEMHKGEIKADSKDGQTTFTFFLPLIFDSLTKPFSEEIIEVAKNLLKEGASTKLISKVTRLKEYQIRTLKI